MYLRFVKFNTQGTDLRRVQEFYREKALPLLQQYGSCRFASLLQATSKDEECISMTLWDSPEEAERYQQGEAYRRLVDESEKLVSDAAEWRVRLSHASGAEPTGAQTQRIGDAFTVEAGDQKLPEAALPSHLYLRIVSVRVRPEKWDDLIDLYETTVFPKVRSMQGCRAAFLVESMHDPDQALSVSIWNREEDAIRYEMSGTFDDLTRRLKDTLDGATKWTVTFGPTGSSTGPPVKGYKQIIGEKL